MYLYTKYCINVRKLSNKQYSIKYETSDVPEHHKNKSRWWWIMKSVHFKDPAWVVKPTNYATRAHLNMKRF